MEASELHEDLRARLDAAALENGSTPTPRGTGALLAYLGALMERNAGVNLTAARDLQEAVEILALNAFAVSRAWARPAPPRLVVDLGSGNGFPGVVAAVLWPEARVLLLERREKKAAAIGACLVAARIPNAEAVACDARELLRTRPECRGAVELVTARAVGTLADVLGLAAPWLARGGRVAHWKGRGLIPEEREVADGLAERLGLVPVPPLAGDGPFAPAWLVVHERRS